MQSDERERAGSDEQGEELQRIDRIKTDDGGGGERERNGAAAAATAADGSSGWRLVVATAVVAGRWVAGTWALRGGDGGWRTAGVVEGAGGDARFRLGEHEHSLASAAGTDSLANRAPTGRLQQLIDLARLEP